MPLQRQLPKLCLRGSIANITMANLDEEDRLKIDEIVQLIVNHPEMQSKRASIIKSFGATIGWDFRDDKTIADQEFHIAIWRGVVNLFYHRKYTFMCQACKCACYMTKRGKIAPIDRQQLVCPNCGQVEVVKPGDSGLHEGDFVSFDEFQAICARCVDHPTCRSSITYVPGEKFYDNPELIVTDPVQLRKFFGEYAWNYTRQQIKENERVEHKKAPRRITGRADEIMLQELLAICRKLKLDYSYDADNVDEKSFEVFLIGLQTPPEFAVELALLRKRALSFDVIVWATRNAVRVMKNSGAKYITSKVSIPEHVMFQEENESDENGFSIQQISFRTVGGGRMDQDDHVHSVDTLDVMQAVRAALPDGTCRAVFDIESGQGAIYNDFSDKFGDGKPKKCHMADYLGVPQRTIGMCHETIRIQCLMHEFVPN